MSMPQIGRPGRRNAAAMRKVQHLNREQAEDSLKGNQERQAGDCNGN